MKFKDIIKDIKSLEVYAPEHFEKYLSHFRNSDEIVKYLSEQGENEIARRIQMKKGASPIEPDYSLPRVAGKDFLPTGTIGVVSGCFDLLHLGHLWGMAYAKQYLSRYHNPVLIVLTLSDANIRAKKGESRPILNINERLEMICNVKDVDYVIPLQESNCLAALEKLRPNYFFKANADRSQEIVRKEMELVESYGGKVVVFPSRPNDGAKSTTELVDSVAKKMMREW